ncbi:unnamed protein product [Rhizoctonia solani]|uniref:Uncharacterized protein n=1 Tax=Rhizoctonia solani TaxID=456999 RepID=A0A8H2WWF8_9AGAM|nr:unnamed protein product [Rhizoctonia solani]
MKQSVVFSTLISASLSLAQLTGILGLSDSCNKAMGQLAIGPSANCLNSMGLINVLTTPSGQSWVGPFDTYLTQTCSQPACPVDILSMTIASLKEGCATDLAEKGWSADDLEKILGQGANYYPSVREVLCLRSTQVGQGLCITTTLTDIQDMLSAPLNIGTLVSKTPTVLNSHSIDIPKNISCTPCTQGAYTIARPNLPSSESVQAWDKFWTNQCGEQFISGTLPTTVAQTANETTATTTAEQSNAAAFTPNLPSLAAVAASFAVALFSGIRVLQA